MHTTQVVIKPKSVLVQWLDGSSKAGEGFPKDRMRMACRVDVRPCLMYFAVDRKGRAVDGELRSFVLHLSLLIDENQIADADLREVLA